MCALLCQSMIPDKDPIIRQIEFELEKAEHGMAMPYDAERVRELRKMWLRRASGSYRMGWRGEELDGRQKAKRQER